MQELLGLELDNLLVWRLACFEPPFGITILNNFVKSGMTFPRCMDNSDNITTKCDWVMCNGIIVRLLVQ
jgi:hypothetical protein